ncbi:unnamed protein product [Albugo candida]|uniref:Uncharacterized protein n=1 Tax=Albugo candida TaxID=65357 RepID=A0A024GM01_9STRA|nr:unnamed protein product [Albugo candida]|eukprot:CCI47546.1 unnamed protein product [Albugo candida]
MTHWYSSAAFVVLWMNASSAQERTSLVSCPETWYPVSVSGDWQIYCIPILPCGGNIGVASVGSCPGGTGCAALPQNPLVMGCVALGKAGVQYLDRTILFSPPVPFTLAIPMQGPPLNLGPPSINNGVTGTPRSTGMLVPTVGPSSAGASPNGIPLGGPTLSSRAGLSPGNIVINPNMQTSSNPFNPATNPASVQGKSAKGSQTTGNGGNTATNIVNQPVGRNGNSLGNTNSLLGNNGNPTRGNPTFGANTPTTDANTNVMPSSNSPGFGDDNSVNNNGTTGDKVTDEQRHHPSDVVGPTTQNSANSRLSLGAIIAIVLGILAVIAVIAGVILLKKNKLNAAAQREQEASIGSSYLTPRERVLLL